MNQLMIDLGFGRNGYIAQGGDIGSDLARRMAKLRPECKAVHRKMKPDRADSTINANVNYY